MTKKRFILTRPMFPMFPSMFPNNGEPDSDPDERDATVAASHAKANSPPVRSTNNMVDHMLTGAGTRNRMKHAAIMGGIIGG